MSWNKLVFKRVVMTLFIWSLLFGSSAQAYSYAAAGKEPLIDGREALLLALSQADFEAIATVANELSDEFHYLKETHHVDLASPMQTAIMSKDKAQIEVIMDQALVEEVVRRLEGAEQNLGDYQVAKVLVVKSKRFLDLVTPKLNSDKRETVNKAIVAALESIGNPGVFGVGQMPADPECFAKERQEIVKALQEFRVY